MVNIAVCDDDTQFAAELENRILSHGKQKAVSLDTESFQMETVFCRQSSTADSMILFIWTLRWVIETGSVQCVR